MKKVTILLMLLLLATSLSAQLRPKIGLVLSGGGAKGAAHVGAIRAIEEAGIPIDIVTGTSMGSIVGGLYSIGYSVEEMDSIFNHQDWIAILSDHLSRRSMTTTQKRFDDAYILSLPLAVDGKFVMPSGILAAQNVLGMLNELTIGYHGDSLDFNTLPIPFACVAFDMVKGEAVVFHKGNLPLAIRSSMSIPWAFEPVVMDTMVLVDGGVHNNFPVDIARQMGADIVIGIDVTAPPQNAEEVNSLVGIVVQLTEIIGRDTYMPNVEDTDVYVRPKLEPYGTMSFTPEAIDSLIRRGYEATMAKWDELQAVKAQAGNEDPTRPHHSPIDRDTIEIGSIRFVGLEHNSERAMRARLGLKENSTTSKAKLISAIERLRGTGAFTSINYMAGNENDNTLTIIVEEKRGITLDFGARFDIERLAALLLNADYMLRGVSGAQIGFTTRLSDNPYLQFRLSSNSWPVGRLGLQYELRYNDYWLYQNARPSNNIYFLQQTAQLQLSESSTQWLKYNIGARYEYFHYPDFTQTALSENSGGYLSYFANLHLGTFDDAYFPERGFRANAGYTLYTDNGLQYRNSDPFHSIAYSFTAALSPAPRLTFVPSLAGQTMINASDAPYPYRNFLGGRIASRYTTGQIDFVGSGYMTEMDYSLLTAQLDVRVRLWRNHFVSLLGGFAVQNNNFFEMFNYELAQSFWGAGVRYAYRTPFGPISLDVGYSTITRWGVYLSLGKTF